MKEKIKLQDNQRIEQLSEMLSRFAHSLNIGVTLFTKMVGVFNLDLFMSIYTRKAKKADVVKLYVEVNGINVGMLDLQKVIDLKLIHLPDFSGMMGYIADQNRISSVSDCRAYLNDITLLFNKDLNKFVELGEDPCNPVYKKIVDAYTVTCETDEDVQFVNELTTFANLFSKFKYEYKFDTGNAPVHLFSSSQIFKSGEVITNIEPFALKRFKEMKSAKPKNTFIY